MILLQEVALALHLGFLTFAVVTPSYLFRQLREIARDDCFTGK